MGINPFIFVKFAISAAVIVAVSEIAKRSPLFGGLIASLPLVSVMAMIWLYHETGSAETVVRLSTGVLLYVLPSCALFVLLPILIRHGMHFYAALGASAGVTALVYGLTTFIAKKFWIVP